MNPFTMLTEEHEQVKKAFKEFENADGAREKKKIATQVMDDLTVHATVEEEIFYPAVRRKLSEDGKSTVAEAFEEHHVVKILIKELQELGTVNQQFEAKFTVLQENVEHHIEEEEGELFPEAKKSLGAKAEELGDKMMKRKEALSAAATR